MSGRKRNQWLEVESDEDGRLSADSDSEHEERSKAQLQSRSIKRRKIDEESNSGDGFSDDEDLDKSLSVPITLDKVSSKRESKKDSKPKISEQKHDDRFARFAEEDEDDEAKQLSLDNDLDAEEAPDPVVTQAQLKAKAKAKKKSGVIYLSRIPPFMKPQTVRTYLSPYGEIGKLFLTPETDATYQRRVKSGGNKKHSFVDGWVEFLSKKDAKTVADELNGNIMGGKKGNYYHDDIWNIKYLKGFKWDDLTEQIARENKEHEARLRAEITKAKRENEGFVRDVERGKMLDTMETRRKERGTKAKNAPNGRAGPAREFKQTAAKPKRPPQGDGVNAGLFSRVL